jgi:hypothetical protein
VRNWSSEYVGKAVGLAGNDVPGITGPLLAGPDSPGDDVQAATTSANSAAATGPRVRPVRIRPLQYGRADAPAGTREDLERPMLGFGGMCLDQPS